MTQGPALLLTLYSLEHARSFKAFARSIIPTVGVYDPFSTILLLAGILNEIMAFLAFSRIHDKIIAYDFEDGRDNV